MKAREFFLYTLAVAIGTSIALAIAGVYLKSQFASAAGGNTTLGSILSFFAPKTSSP